VVYGAALVRENKQKNIVPSNPNFKHLGTIAKMSIITNAT